MRIVYSERTELGGPAIERAGARPVAPFGSPARGGVMVRALQDHGIATVEVPTEHGPAAGHAGYDADYVPRLFEA